jgi:GAF domain-containing protein
VIFALGFLVDFFTVSTTVSEKDFVGWIAAILVLVIVDIFIGVSINYLIPGLIDSMSESGRLTRELTEYQSQLEDLVAQQELDLARRSAQLNAAAQVAREAAQVLELEQVLDNTVRLISERFGFYHAGIYLADELGEYAVLQAASSEGGQVMLTRGFQLKIGEQGIVGYVISKGEPRIALDVDSDGVFLNVPDLPHTRSEIALPLHTRDGVIGALDVQSEEPAAFVEEDVIVLQTLADQIALVISNAQLVRQTELRLETERQVFSLGDKSAWQDLLVDLEQKGFIRNEAGLSPAEDIWHSRMAEAARSGELAVSHEENKAVTIPIKVRGQTIGVIDAKKPEDAGAWTQDELNLLQTFGAQLDPALDSAQLYEDTQLRASRERFTRELADKMRRASNMDALIRTTIEELTLIMDTSSVFVQLVDPSDSENESTTL